MFKKNGLEVELVHIPSTSRAIQTLLAGELAYTYMDGRTSVQATLKGADVGYHRRGRQSFGVFLYRPSGDQELQ